MRHILVTLAIACGAMIGGSPSLAQTPFKNLQVLGSPSDTDLYAAMSFMAGSLGVSCEHCHVNPWDSDARKAKATARRMIKMVRSLNEASFEGRQVVTCQTCHRGSVRPASIPDLANAAWQHPLTKAADAIPAPPPVPIERVIASYFAAVGAGAQAARTQPRHLVGTFELNNGMRPPQTVPLDVLLGPAGELRVLDSFPNRPSLAVWNGREGWTKRGAQAEPMTAADIEEARRTVEMYRVFDPRDLGGLQVVAARPDGVNIEVTASGPADHPERLWFSSATGLLVRRETMLPSPLGSIVERIDYEDYRDAGGIRVPFTIVVSAFAQRMRLVFTQIEAPARLPAGAFDKP